jgi:hypothetical protein
MLSQLASLVRLLAILSAAVLVVGQTQDPEAIWAQVRIESVGKHIRQLMCHDLILDQSEQQLALGSWCLSTTSSRMDPKAQ